MADKKFYWLKLNHDFFNRSDIKIIEDMENGKDYVLFYLKLMLESISHNGELRFNETIPYNEKMLSTITNTNIDIVRSAMSVFTTMGMVEVLDDDTIYMTEVEKMIGSAVDNDNANRQRRFREKKKALAIADVTKSNALVTESNENNNESKSIEIDTDKEIELESEIELEKKPAKRNKFVKPTIDELRSYIEDNGYSVDAERFYDYYEANGWYAGNRKMKDWQATVRNWDRRENERVNKKFSDTKPYTPNTYTNPYDDENL